MSDYTKSTNFATKDNLSSGNPLKIVKGTEIDTEFNNIAITIEPILNFDLIPFVQAIRRIKPKWVYIGADSKSHHLPEPQAEKIALLIQELKELDFL